MKRYSLDGQLMYVGNDTYEQLRRSLEPCKKILLVHGRSYKHLPIADILEAQELPIVEYTDFSPNPKYEDAVRGRNLFLDESCDCILSVGGGSAIDIGKSIKLFAAIDDCDNYLKAEKKSSDVRHIAIPTTAGTGSESNQNAVLYKDGEKQSLKHASIIPDHAFLIPELVYDLPEYQKKSTMLDALCQCFESIWAVGSTYESRSYSVKGIHMLLEHMDQYLKGDLDACESILFSANLSGRATNISQTTAAHAMSYKLASMYGISHGHAVALSLPYLCDYTIKNTHKVRDSLSENEIAKHFKTPKHWMEDTMYMLLGLVCPGSKSLECLVNRLHELVRSMKFNALKLKEEKDIEILVQSVNPTRLSNNPIVLDEAALASIYMKVFES